MTHVFRWRQTRFGPVQPELASRFGERCRVIVRAPRPLSAVWIEFADGGRFVTSVYAIRKAGA